jgi:primary-amine oxidase
LEVVHPLDPLIADEVRATTSILRESGKLGDGDRVVQILLHEPPKQAVLGFEEGDSIERRAEVVILSQGKTHEAIVSLGDGVIERHEHIPGVQSAITLAEFDECEAVCKADPNFQAALAKRGVTDFDQVMVDPWSYGSYGDGDASRRLSRALTYVRMYGPDDNAYAHPVDNLIVIFDLGEMKIVEIEDHGVIPVPAEEGNYDPASAGQLRDDLKPISITQPEGPSFELVGNQLKWLDWEMRIGFNAKEGLIIYQAGINKQGEHRSVLYRGSISEIVTPYGDPAPCQARKNAFDFGEYNAGSLVNQLELGCDCLGEISYLDAVLADTKGDPMVVKNAICIHEEDAGLLWKHTDLRTGKAEVRRSRRLVVSFVATVANYDYGFYWYFLQDGTIHVEVKATGIVQTGAHGPDGATKFGQTLNPDGLYAPIHQHLFNARLDVNVDGLENSVVEVNTVAAEAGPENPYGAAFLAEETPLKTESEAKRKAEANTARHWKVVNPGRKNRVGEEVGYRLVPTSAITPLSSEEASVTNRAAFARYALWVTPYAPDEQYAAGPYPNQHQGGAGLPEWTQADRSLESEDLVLWHAFGLTHVVRLEDWPVMPVQRTGFKLEPVGFFDMNPTLDVPPPEPGHSCHAE